MKKLTKWLALAVALLMVALMMVACDTPKEPEKTPSEGLFYRLNADGESYSVEGIGECTDTDIVIPSTYEGKPVTSIDDYAFDRCNSLTSITIPDSVTRIGDSAFIAYSSLISITVDSENPVYHSAGNCLIETETKTLIMGCNNSMIPTDGSVTSIGSSAFFGCDALTSITIPDSVTRIGNWAFLGCSALTSVTIPDSVTYIGDRAFESCSSLEDIVIPDGVTRIGYNAFAGCTNLAANLVIPHSVAHIGWGAFDGCGSLASITVDSENPVYHSAENCLIETERKTLIKGCNNSVIPTDGSVTSIGDSAFELCNSLTSITIPDSVTSIGDSAFFGCSSLTNITIPDSVTRIGGDAFAYCTNFSSVTIPKGVTHIGDSAFRDCSGLASITVA